MNKLTHKMLYEAGKTSNAIMSQADSVAPCLKHFFPIGEKTSAHKLVTIGATTQIDYDLPHGATTGDTVTVSGVDVGTPDINGPHVITVLDTDSISIPVDTSASLDAYANGITTPNTIRDIIGDAVFTGAGAFIGDAALGSLQFNSLVPVLLASGGFVDINDKDFLFVTIATAVDDAIAGLHVSGIGRATSIQGGINTAADGVANVSDAAAIFTTSANASNAVAGDAVAFAIAVDRNGLLTSYITGDFSGEQTVDISALTGFVPESYFYSYGLKVQSMLLYTFENGLPTNWKAGVDKMQQDMSAEIDGNKRAPYAGFVAQT